MFSMSYQLRLRKDINWKLPLKGESIPRDAERLIVRKTQSTNTLYLVKWKGYHIEESTWEPECHLSEFLRTNYFTPAVSQERLAKAAFHFENAVQNRLRSRNCLTSVSFELDIFRFCFGTDVTVLLNKDDFQKLPLSSHWYYNINKLGRGVQLSFPIKCQPKLLMKKTFVYADGKVIPTCVPTEKILVTSAVDGLHFSI